MVDNNAMAMEDEEVMVQTVKQRGSSYQSNFFLKELQKQQGNKNKYN